MDAPLEITCMECGGTAHLLSSPPPDLGFTAGDILAYVCADCDQRIDVVFEEDAGEQPTGETG